MISEGRKEQLIEAYEKDPDPTHYPLAAMMTDEEVTFLSTYIGLKALQK